MKHLQIRNEKLFIDRFETEEGEYVAEYFLNIADLRLLVSKYIATFKFAHPLKGITIRHRSDGNGNVYGSTLFELNVNITSILYPHGNYNKMYDLTDKQINSTSRLKNYV